MAIAHTASGGPVLGPSPHLATFSRTMAASMHHPETHASLPQTKTSHPKDPIPEEPTSVPQHAVRVEDGDESPSSLTDDSTPSTDSEGPTTPSTTRQVDEALDEMKDTGGTSSIFPTALPPHKRRRASTRLITSNPEDVRRLLATTDTGTQLVGRVCCGGGCCFLTDNAAVEDSAGEPIQPPDNPAYRSLNLDLGTLTLGTKLTNTVDLPPRTVSFENLATDEKQGLAAFRTQPPPFVTPHPPYDVFSAKVQNARELTAPGAEKRTYHFDLDVTDYPEESGDVDFKVGGAIGICVPNSTETVDEVFDVLGVPRFVRDRNILCRTTGGRWPTIWGDEKPRELQTTRRELLAWCTDVQSYPPTKPLLRLLAEYATDAHERKILMYLSSAQGQATFCDLRTGPYITLLQLLHAFPSCKPPFDHLLSVANQLMPRFYSLSHDPQFTPVEGVEKSRRLIEIAVTVHELPHWQDGKRTGVGSGYLERVARAWEESKAKSVDSKDLDLRVPMFRGLMANPLAKEFVSDGPMLLVGAGVGIAPFRGFVQRRLKSANCANKVWVLQGIRDSLLDELYRGEWGVEEEQVKKVVQSRKGKGRYVQDEVRHQADLVWFIVNAIDGRIFVCGSTKGMGEGVEAALVDVAMEKGNLNHDAAVAFWKQKKEEGQYVSETW